MRRKAQQASRQQQATSGRGPNGRTSHPRTRGVAQRNVRTATAPVPRAAPSSCQWLRRHRCNNTQCSNSSGSSRAAKYQCSRRLTSRRARTRTRGQGALPAPVTIMATATIGSRCAAMAWHVMRRTHHAWHAHCRLFGWRSALLPDRREPPRGPGSLYRTPSSLV